MRGRLVLAVLVAAGCYEQPNQTCAIRCDKTAADACPGSLVCNDEGYCVGSAGDVCTLALSTVRVGAHHMCGLDTAGHLYCWGDDELGEVGLGTGSDAVVAPTTVGDPGDHWTAVATGGDHTCAIKGGDVYCWGQNDSGETRGNAGGTQLTPAKVAISPTTPLPASGFQQIAAGGEHSCAIGEGQLWCWGAKEAIGQDHSFMERVGTLDDWTEISLGKNHSCGISTSMGLLCWGHDDRGQAGQPDYTDRAMPTSLGNGPPAGVALHVVAGDSVTCALFGTAPTDPMGQLFCWGDNGWNQITDNNGANPVPAATMIGATSDWTAVTTGGRVICATRGGHAHCWGQTFMAGLGDGVFSEQFGPSNANDLGEADDVQLGVPTRFDQFEDLGCLTTGGQIKCWGDNEHGSVGAGIPANMTPRPVEVIAPSARPWTHVVSGHHHVCATDDHGVVYCWGADDSGQISGQPGRGDTSAPCLPTEPCNFAIPIIAPVSHADVITAGNYFACALDGSTLTCWGDNDHGDLGASGGVVRPVSAPGGEAWNGLLGGDRGNCGTTASGRLYCWGFMYNGQSVATPVEQTDTDLMPSMTELRLGDNYACGVRADHTRICWGQNNNYQLGIDSNLDVTDPSFMNMLSYVDHIATRNDHVCAVGDMDQHIACWGEANERELGTTSNPVTSPNAVTTAGGQGLTGCTSVSTGDGMSCAACMGQVSCWGEDYSSELGRGTRTDMQDEHAATVALPTNLTFTTVVSGSNHTCALSMDGRLFCWGYGPYGELGNGGKAQPVPTLLAPGR